MKKVLLSLIILICNIYISYAQPISFNTQVLGSNFAGTYASAGITFVIKNNNSYPIVLTSIANYFGASNASAGYTLWYSTTSISGTPHPVNFPVWSPIISVTGVAVTGGIQNTIFPTLSFNIPSNTTYRFFIQPAAGSIMYYSGPLIPLPTPSIMTNTGVDLLLGDYTIAGQVVGFAGATAFTPRWFTGTIGLNLLSTPCVGAPTAGVATALPNNPCPGTNIILNMVGGTSASGLAYQWQRSSSPAGPWLSIAGGTTNPYSYMPPPSSVTFYRCILSCLGSGLNDTSNTTGAVSIQPWSITSACYCNGLVTSTATTDIGQFTLGTFINPTGPIPVQLSNPTATGGVTNFTSLPTSPTVVQGLSYPVNIHQITSSAALATSWAKVWIDFNHNTNFTDPGEEVFSSASDASNAFSSSGTIFIPPSSLPGCTRMRVKLQTTGSAIITTPCNNITSGEVEDYVLCITPAGPYDPTITGVSAPTGNNCTDSTETLSATICNYGSTNMSLSVINPAYITFLINSPSGLITVIDTITSGTLSAFGAGCITRSKQVNMYMGGNYLINAFVSCPTFTNAFLGNDSLANAINILNYRPTAGLPYNLCQNSLMPFGQGLTVGGCSAPVADSVEITFNLTSCIDNVGAIVNGITLGPNNSNCNNTYAGNFGNGLIPLLPPGAYFTQNAILTIDHLSSAAITEPRFILYSGTPVGASLYAGCATGFNTNAGNIILAGQSLGPTTNFTNTRHITPTQLSAIFGSLTPGALLNIGYWETQNNAFASSDIALNVLAPTTATLKIYYEYVPPTFSWYDVPTGGASLYLLSPFDPLSNTNAVVNNSNVTGTYTFYAACQGLPACRIPVDLIINPTPASCQDTMLACEYAPSSNNAIFNIDTMKNRVSCFNAATSVEFFGDQALLSPIQFPLADTTSTSIIYSKVYYASTGCFSSDTLYLEVSSIPEFLPNIFSGFACAPNCVDIASLIYIFPSANTDTLFFEDSAFSTPFVGNPHCIAAADTVYCIVKTANSAACADSAVAYVAVTPASNYIASQILPASYSSPGPIPCGNITLTNGITETLYTTTDCRKIATITDSLSDFIDLGSTTICEDIFNGVPVHNTQPYLNRSFQITPTNDGKAQVCLYILADDIASYDAVANSLFPSWPSMNPMANLSITQVENGPIGTPGSTAVVIPDSYVTSLYDPITFVWKVCFPVDSFSHFYLHATNPLNTPLPVTLYSFKGKKVNETSVLNWATSSEHNNNYFIVERSKDGKIFNAISSKINSKAPNGNSNVNIEYSFIDNLPLDGHNYYRLKQLDIDGIESESQIIDIYFGDETMVSLYPNPVNTELTIEINTPKATTTFVKIMDATGRVVRTVEIPLQAGNNVSKIDLQSMADGVYMVNITNNKGLNYSQTIRKK